MLACELVPRLALEQMGPLMSAVRSGPWSRFPAWKSPLSSLAVKSPVTVPQRYRAPAPNFVQCKVAVAHLQLTQLLPLKFLQLRHCVPQSHYCTRSLQRLLQGCKQDSEV